MYTIYFSPIFERELKRLVKKQPQLISSIQDKLQRLIDDPKSKALRLHKLSGSNNWSISITRKIRIIFAIRGNEILCLHICSHDEVY